MLKKVVSLVLFFSLFFMLLTALVVFVEPSSRVASWANWTFLGLSRQHWDGAHLGMGLLFIVAGLLHLVLNWDALLGHLRDRDGAVVVFTKPFFLGLAVTVLVFIAALAELPPISQLVGLSGYLKERAADTFGEPPYSGAERSTLEDLARRMGMDAEKALALLRLKNIKAESASQTLAEIASKNGVAPGGVFEALRMVMEPSGGGAVLPKDPPPGLGRRKLSDICEEYGLDPKAVLARLEASGLKAQSSMTLAEVAKANNALPIAVYEILRAEKAPAAVQVEPASGQKAVEVAPQPVQPAPQPAQQPVAPQPASQPAAQPAVPPAVTAQPQPAPAGQLPAPGYPAPPQTPSGQPGYAPAPAGQLPAPGYPAQPHAQPGFVQPGQPGYAPAPAGQLPPPGYPAPPHAQPGQPGYAQPGQPGYAQPGHAAPPAGPATPPPGLEKMMLQSFCREYDIPLSVAVQRLARHRITAFGDMTFEELSLENNRTPTDIMRLVTQ